MKVYVKEGESEAVQTNLRWREGRITARKLVKKLKDYSQVNTSIHNKLDLGLGKLKDVFSVGCED